MKAEQKRVHSKAYHAARIAAAKLGSDEEAKDLPQPKASPPPPQPQPPQQTSSPQHMPHTTATSTTTTKTITTTTTHITTIITHSLHDGDMLPVEVMIATNCEWLARDRRSCMRPCTSDCRFDCMSIPICACLATLSLVNITLLCMLSDVVARVNGIVKFSGHPLQHNKCVSFH
jgi:hypothetical protein